MEHGWNHVPSVSGGFMLLTALKLLSKFEEYAIALLLAFNLAILFVTVVFRYILGHSPTWPEEASRYVMIWIVYIGVSQSIEKKSEIKIDALTRIIKTKTLTTITNYFSLVACLLVSIIIIYFGYDFCKLLMATGTSAASFPMPMYIIYSVIPASGILIFLKYITKLIEMIRS